MEFKSDMLRETKPTEFPAAHVVDLGAQRQAGQQVQAGKDDAERQRILFDVVVVEKSEMKQKTKQNKTRDADLENGHDAQEDDESQDGEGGVRLGVDVRMPRLVDLQHAQHRDHVHERSV